MAQLHPLNSWIRSQPGFIVGDGTEESVLDMAYTSYEQTGGQAMTRDEYERELKKTGNAPECQPDRDASSMPPYIWRWVLRMPDGEKLQ